MYVNVIKATGEKEPFSEEKLRLSIHRAGVSDAIQNLVVQHIKSKLYEGIPTSEIYNHIIEFLAASPHPYSRSKYSLKHSIMQLGPTGYPFEDYVSEILKFNGYETKVRQILSGKCITHEVDVIAKRNGEKAMIEAKFHNQPGTKTSIHVALYTKARFDDVLERNDINKAWLVTNTKITQDVITYAHCIGMKVVSWNYPEGDSLRDLVEQTGLTPITALSTLSQDNIRVLLNQNIVMAKDLCSSPGLLSSLHVSREKQKEVLSELEFVCGVKNQ